MYIQDVRYAHLYEPRVAEGDKVDAMDIVLDVVDEFDGQDVETFICRCIPVLILVKQLNEAKSGRNNQSYTTTTLFTANCWTKFYHFPVWHKFNATFAESSCEEHYSLWCTAQSAPNELMAIEKHGFSQELDQLMAIHKISPHGITERKRRTATFE